MLFKFTFILLVSIPVFCYSQKSDSIYFKINKIDTASIDDYYSVLIFNGSTHPICILYSASLLPINLETPKLVPFKENSQTASFSFNYCAHDTLFDDLPNNENNNLNAYILLPLQKINFDISVPKLAKGKDLKVEYILLDNLHYEEFQRKIFSNAVTWYKIYKKFDRHLSLD
jgi:hypothetical protein